MYVVDLLTCGFFSCSLARRLPNHQQWFVKISAAEQIVDKM
jgi:hypothetical protein